MRDSERTLGNSDLVITPVGFGAWAIGGGDWEFAWGAQDDRESIEAIQQAVKLGMNWIDTAAVYGLGHSEEVVGQAVRDIPSADRPYIFTKCSLIWGADRKVGHSLESASIKQECEHSLGRLGLETIDLYQIHWAGFRGGPESASPGSVEEAVGALGDLQREGKIRHIGVSNFNVDQLQRASKIATIASLQPPYSLVRRDIEAEILPWCKANHVGVIVYSPMQSGLLTGTMTHERIAQMPQDDWRRNNPQFKEPALSKNLEFVESLRPIAKRHDSTPGEIAIAWTLRNDQVTGAIVGSRSSKQVEGVIGAATIRLTAEELAEIDKALAKLA